MAKFNPISYKLNLHLALPNTLLEAINDALTPVGFLFEQERLQARKRTVSNINSAKVTVSLLNNNCFLMDFKSLSLHIQECFQSVKMNSRATDTLMWNAVTGLLKEIDHNTALFPFHRTTDRKHFLSFPLDCSELRSITVGKNIEFKKKNNTTGTGEVVAIVQRGECLADVLDAVDLHANCKNIRNIHAIKNRPKFVVGVCNGKGSTYTLNLVAPESIIAVH